MNGLHYFIFILYFNENTREKYELCSCKDWNLLICVVIPIQVNR